MASSLIALPSRDLDPSALVQAVEASDGNFIQDVVLVLGEDDVFDKTRASSYNSDDDSDASSSEGEETLSSSLRSTGRISVRVSSSRLRHASPVFEAMLFNTSFREAHELATKGTVEIQLPEDDPVAFLLVLCVTHDVKTKMLPGEVGLDSLVNIAVLADKYLMHGSLQDAGQEWAEQLRKREGMPWSASEDETARLRVAKWLCIASVFGLEEMSTQLAHIAEKTSTGRLDLINDEGLVLPLRPKLVDEIESRRCETIGTYISLIERLTKSYSISNAMKMSATAATATVCKRKTQVYEHKDGNNAIPCLSPANVWDAKAQYGNRKKGHVKLKGVIATQLAEARLWPLPKPPYEGLSCIDLRKAVLCLQIPECHSTQRWQKEENDGKVVVRGGQETKGVKQMVKDIRRWWKSESGQYGCALLLATMGELLYETKH